MLAGGAALEDEKRVSSQESSLEDGRRELAPNHRIMRQEDSEDRTGVPQALATSENNS